MQQRLDKAEQQITTQVLEIQTRIAEARTDSLTGLVNRRVFDEELKRRLAEWQRYGRPLGIILADLDSFKTVNDTYGHQIGDEVLRNVGRVMTQVAQETDVVCRYGGEEFAMIVSAVGATSRGRNASSCFGSHLSSPHQPATAPRCQARPNTKTGMEVPGWELQRRVGDGHLYNGIAAKSWRPVLPLPAHTRRWRGCLVRSVIGRRSDRCFSVSETATFRGLDDANHYHRPL